jgi:hypothetical protein
VSQGKAVLTTWGTKKYGDIANHDQTARVYATKTGDKAS